MENYWYQNLIVKIPVLVQTQEILLENYWQKNTWSWGSKLVNFQGYEYISDLELSASQQFEKVKELGIDTPIQSSYPRNVTKIICPRFEAYKKSSKYEIDELLYKMICYP